MIRTHLRRSMGNQRGVSLIETLVALGLFAIVTAGMGNFLVQQIRHASSNHLHTVAYDLAIEELEQARAELLADIVPESKEVEQGGVTFSIEIRVDDDTPAAGLKQITAEVAWNEPGGPKTVSVPTIYTEIRRF